MGLLIFLIILIIFVLCLLFANIRIVPQAHAFVIERLGKYKVTWEAGLHVKTPFIEKVIKDVSLKEQVLDFPPQPVITKDNVTMQIDSVVFMKVFDPKLYTYGVENPMVGLQNLSATTLRNIIGDMELDQTLTSREAINAKMQKILDEATDAWGIKVTRVEIKNIQPPHEIEEVMTKQMRAERERRQTVLEAQAHQEAVVSRAEGDKKAKILAAEAERDAQIALAEGRAKSIELVYKAQADGLRQLTEANPSDKVIQLQSLNALRDVADGRATKIFLPTDLANAANLASTLSRNAGSPAGNGSYPSGSPAGTPTGNGAAPSGSSSGNAADLSSAGSLIGALGVAGEALGVGDATPIDKTPKEKPPVQPDPCITPDTGKGGVDAYVTSATINEDVAHQARRGGI